MVYLKLIEISIIVVIVIDISGFVDSIKEFIGKMLNITNVRLKPLDCSFCVNWWLSLLYIYITNNLTLSTILFALLCSTLTPTIQDLIYLIRELIANLINKISNLIN